MADAIMRTPYRLLPHNQRGLRTLPALVRGTRIDMPSTLMTEL
jgi:hypothetical protein